MDDVAALRDLAARMHNHALPPWCHKLGDWLNHCATDLADADGNLDRCDNPGEMEHAQAVGRAYAADPYMPGDAS